MDEARCPLVRELEGLAAAASGDAAPYATYDEWEAYMLTGSPFWPRIRAELEADARGWQPIATAPRDGTVVWAYCAPKDDPYKRPAYQAEIYYKEDAWVDVPTYWHEPTHWQPLPHGPEVNEEEQRERGEGAK
jgi:hypothetical protein